ncbi:conserved hypothetical protein [delta proteobacterium NaphS2]|nr:conserved hypothetical protein [delta proteobacterium NaphS2]
MYDPATAQVFVSALKDGLTSSIPIQTAPLHINDPLFAETAASMMDEMIRGSKTV